MTELSIIVPTFNEVSNIRLMYDAINKALPDVDWELIYVDDDSTDGTLDTLATLCQEKPGVRRLHRIGRRGLSSAVVEGFQARDRSFRASGREITLPDGSSLFMGSTGIGAAPVTQ